MALYAEVEDVLRVLGGTLDGVQTHFDLQLWDGSYPVTSVTVDTNTFDVPDTVLARIGVQLENADSRIDGYVLQAYQARPTNVPPHLRLATAQLAAYHTLVTDGVRTDYIKSLHEETHSYMKDLAAGKFDLGTEAPRPLHRAPAAVVVTGVGGLAARGRGRGGGSCGGGCFR